MNRRKAMFLNELEELRKRNLLRSIADRASAQGPRIRIDGRELINFGSNDYLGLANHPEIAGAAIGCIESFGFGSGASRVLGGGTTLHRDLEERIARFKGAEAALLINSGYAANTGIIPALAGEGDIIFSDELNHASIIDGCRLSRAETVIYRHRDLAHLRNLLQEYSQRSAGKLIVATDSVFSMDGDIAPLREIFDLGYALNSEKSTEERFLLYIDDAHGTGVIGRGRGALDHFDLRPEPWIIQIGTFSKALGSYGAFVAGAKDVIEWISNRSRSFIFSTALPACTAAAALRSVEMLETKPDLVLRLWENRDRLITSLGEIGYATKSETPIVPLRIGDTVETLEASRRLFERAIYAPAIRPPTVREPRLRITITAAHLGEDIDSLVRALSEIQMDEDRKELTSEG